MKFFTLVTFYLLTISAFSQTFNVGSRTIVFNDPARTGGTGSGGGAGRQIQTDIVYPAVTTGANATVAAGKFPVVVFGHGFVMETTVYKAIFDSLAKLGYICALPKTEGSLLPAPSHTDFGKDLAIVLDKLLIDTAISFPFYGKVNGKGAIAGHSMGGGATFLANQYTNNAVCYFTMAPANTNPPSVDAALTLNKPICILSGTSDCVAGYAAHQKPMYDSLKTNTCKQLVSIANARHCSFSDGSSFNCNFGEGTSGCASSPLTTAQQLVIVRSIMVPYFNYFLKGICSEWNVYQNYITTTTSLTTIQSCTMNVPSNASVLGDTAFCVGSSANLSASPSGFNYTWSSSQTSQNINVNQAGNYSVNVANAYCSINSASFAVAQKTAPASPSLQQNISNYCSNAGNITLTIPAVSNAAYYVWTAPQGWSVVSDDSSSTFVATPGSAGKFYVAAYGNDCGLGKTDSLEITFNQLPTLNGVVTGTASICSNLLSIQSFVFNGTLSDVDSLRWSANSWQLAGGQGSDSATFQPNALSDTIKVYGINNCGVSATQLFAVNVLDTTDLPLLVAGTTITATQGFTAYKWYRNDTLIIGANSEIFTATAGGVYRVEGVNANSCTSNSEEVSITITVSGIADDELNTLRVYPNPAKGLFFVELGDLQSNTTFVISDMSGRTILQQKLSTSKTSIDVSSFSKGVYALVIKNARNESVRRLIIE